MDLSKHEFFTFFPADPGKLIMENAEILTFDEPTTLFEEGDEGGVMYLILAGEVEISGTTASGTYQSISILREHDFFGEFSAIDGCRRNARACILQSATLAMVPRDVFLRALETSPINSLQKFLAHVIKRIRLFHNRFFQKIVGNQKMLLVGELTNTIMHDIKSPMSIITGTANVISERYKDDDELAQLCDLITLQVSRVQDMSAEVLDYVRGNTTIVQKEINLKTLFPYFDLLNRDFFARQGVKLVMSEPDVIMNADPDKLVRIMQNLANNAAQSMKDGGCIEIDATLDDDVVTITIKDDGPGIPDDIREHLFDPFVGEGKNGGTGLGTTIAMSLVKSHSGKLSFETGPDGTTFFVQLPKNLDAEV